MLVAATFCNAADKPKEAALMDWSHCKAAYRISQKWIKQGHVDQVSKPRPIWVSHCTGVRVTLRWLGLTMGVGEAAVELKKLPGITSESTDPTTAIADLADLTRAAVVAALKSASEKLKDQAARSADPVPKNERMTLAKLGPRLLVDIQFAHRLEAIRLPDKTSPAAIYYSFAPGYHGLCVGRLGPDKQVLAARVWPATSLATNATPQNLFTRLFRKLGYADTDLPRLGHTERGGIPLARFAVIHLVKPTSDQPVMRLERGQLILPPTPISGQTLDAMANRMTNHLKRKQLSDGHFVGTYHPTSDRWDPPEAPIADTALAAYAIGQRAALLQATDPDAIACFEAKDMSRKAVQHLIKTLLPKGKKVARDPAAMALLLLTLVESPHLATFKPQRDAVGLYLEGLIQKDGTFRPMMRPGGKVAKLSFTFRALILSALSSLYEQTRDKSLKETITKAQEQLWLNMDTKTLASRLNALPWLLALETRMQKFAGAKEQAASADRSKLFRELLDVVSATQVKAAPAHGPADVVGGYIRFKQPPNTPPNPDWLTTHILTFVSKAMRDEQLIKSEDRVQWILDSGLAARFLAQLMIDEPGCFYVRSPRDAVGGLRLAMWNNKVGVAPTAMALLATIELQKTLSKLD